MKRKRISSGTEWESRVGYSRAVQAGSEVHVSGTTATDDEGDVVGKDDPYKQTVQTLQNIQSALEQTDASLKDIIRTRMFVTDIDEWKEVGDAHSEILGDVRPTTSIVEVNRLIDPELLVEIEAVAVIAK
jgi:enamine deaminase RidA (YjgF/YER057c/UK114 family)